MARDSNTDIDLERLGELLASRCNETISEIEREELEVFIASSSKAQEIYRETMAIHAGLRWLHRGRFTCDALFDVLEDEGAVDDRVGTSAPESTLVSQAPAKNRLTWFIAVAAGLLVALPMVFWLLDRRGSEIADNQSAATSRHGEVLGSLTLVSNEGHWSFGAPGKQNRSEFLSGETLWLDQGAAALRLTNGIVVQLEAPLILQMMSTDYARVLRGRITADVPSGAEGFTVETAAAEIVDLGTTFSVDVAESGDTDVVVFQGKVDVRPALQKPEAVAAKRKERLLTGEALRVAEDGTLSRIVNVRRPDLSGSRTEPYLIKEVRDNVVRGQTKKYYEIVAGGMGEEALTFVDRGYEWNGADDRGIPGYLMGGDYVKTFNDDKVLFEDLVITVSFERPAVLYLLVDDRLEDTSWLNDQFVDTGDDIGVDEGPRPVIRNDVRRLGKGPGESIDQVHSIWKCREVGSKPISIGPSGTADKDTDRRGTKAKLNMYGIVAVPVTTAGE